MSIGRHPFSSLYAGVCIVDPFHFFLTLVQRFRDTDVYQRERDVEAERNDIGERSPATSFRKHISGSNHASIHRLTNLRVYLRYTVKRHCLRMFN
jgi:hypothetical protein